MKKTQYKIIKFFKNGRKSKILEKNLTLEEAKRYCNREDTKKEGEWFCGFTEQ